MGERDELDEVLDGAEDPACVLYNTDEPYFDLATRIAARTIRDRERKLAGLAHEYATAARRMQANPTALFNRGDWLARYERALK